MPSFNGIVHVPSEALGLVVIMVPFGFVSNLCQSLLKWNYHRKRFLILVLGGTAVHALALVLAVLVFDPDVVELLIVILCTSILQSVVGLAFIREWIAWPRGLGLFRQMLPYAAPYGLIGISAALAPVLERTLTDRALGLDNVGYYAVGTKVAMLSGLLVGAFQSAWGPFSHALYKHADASSTFNQILRGYAIVISLFTLLVSLGSRPLINMLASDRYSEAAIVVFPLSMGIAVRSTSWITEVGISLSKRSHLNFVPYATSLAVSLGSIVILAPALGLVGVGAGVMLGQICGALLASWLAQRAYPLPWCYRPVVALMSVTIMVGSLATWIGYRLGTATHTITSLVGIVSVAVLGWTMLFSKLERTAILHAARQRASGILPRSWQGFSSDGPGS
jgi:O-antigen/teichoic acid export membrane protein